MNKGTKIIIRSTAPYIAWFNGQKAKAAGVEGLISKNYGFDLDTGGRIFLTKEDYVFDNSGLI